MTYCPLASDRAPCLFIISLIACCAFAACGTSSGEGPREGEQDEDVMPALDVTIDDADLGDTPEPPGDTAQPPRPDTTPPGPDTTTPGPDVDPECGGFEEPCCGNSRCDGTLVCEGGLCVAPPRVSLCEEAPSCFAAAESTTDAQVTIGSGAAPGLSGGPVADSAFTLRQITLYTDTTFSPGIINSVEVRSNGATFGGLEFRGEEWSFYANLDLFLDLDAQFVGAVSQPFNFDVAGGGCFATEANRIVGDLVECGDAWPEGAVAPSFVEYGVNGNEVRIILVVTREIIASTLPANIRQFAGFVLAGDLPILLSFARDP